MAAALGVAQAWDAKYPTIAKTWRARLADIITLFDFPAPIRKAIYTTNANGRCSFPASAFDVRCPMFDVRSPLRNSMFDVRCSMFVPRFSVRCSFPASAFDVQCSFPE
ncbi:MAG: transposase [Pirellulaceae bacterium]